MTLEAAKDWCFRNRETGEITIGQPPNALARAAVVCSALRRVGKLAGVRGPLDSALMIAETGAIALFGSDELIRGVNPWRRAIGASALAFCVRRALTS